MTSNPEPIVQHVQGELHNLLADVTGPEARLQTADTGELTLFRRLLALGAARWRRFVVTRAAGRPGEPVTAPDGTRLTAHDRRPTTDDAVFGHVRVARHVFTAPEPEGRCPLEAERSVPARGDADRRREWAVDGTTDASSRERQTVLARLLGRSLSVQALETGVTEAGADVPTVDAPPVDPRAPVPAGPLLVVPAEGTGVPSGPPPTPRLPVRLGKGQPRGRKQAAVVPGLSTSAPYPRTAQEVVGALVQEPGGPAAPRTSPRSKACIRS